MNAPTGRRLVAAGVTRHHKGRTTALIITEAGVTGRITTRAAYDPDGEPAPAPDDTDIELPTAA